MCQTREQEPGRVTAATTAYDVMMMPSGPSLNCRQRRQGRDSMLAVRPTTMRMRKAGANAAAISAGYGFVQSNLKEE